MIAENHFRKFLFYVTGEILRVMIGILFARQVTPGTGPGKTAKI